MKLNDLFKALLLLCIFITSSSQVLADVYTKITSNKGLTAGDKYLLVYEIPDGNGTRVLESIDKSNKYGTGYYINQSNNQITITNQAIAVLTLESSNTYWKLKSSLDSKYLHWSSDNSLTTDDTGSEWTISIANGVATIQHATTKSRKLQWYDKSSHFACYESTQQSVALYKLSSTVAVESVALNKNATSITCGSTETLEATVSPDNASNKYVSWSSSNENVATVEDGVVTAKAVGTTVVTATSNADATKTASCHVTVTADATAVTTAVLFHETFDKCSGTGGTGTYSGSVGSSTIYTDESWTARSNCGGADKCLKFGTSSDASMTTSTISLTGSATLTYRVAGWKSGTNTLAVSATGATVSGDIAITMTAATWTPHTVSITGATGSVTITFSGGRGFIDDIKIVQKRTTVDVTLNAAGFASYCSPFALNLTPTADYTAYTVAAAGGNAVTFTKIPGRVAANTPFILYNPDNASQAVSIPIIANNDAAIAAVSNNELVGTLSPTYVEAAEGYYNFGLSGSKFAKMNTGVVKANKAYLPVSNTMLQSSAPSLSIVFNHEETTNIHHIEQLKEKKGVLYNLSGQRINTPSKGLYIWNGRKVIVR